MKYSNFVYIGMIGLLIAGSIAIADDISNELELIIPPELEQVEPSRIADAIELVAQVTGMRADSSKSRDVVWVKIFVDENTGKPHSIQAAHWNLDNLWLEDVAQVASILAIENAEAQVLSTRGSWFYQPVVFTLFMEDKPSFYGDMQSGAEELSSQEPIRVTVEAAPIHLEEVEFSNDFTRNIVGGTVSLYADLGKDGKVNDVIIFNSSGVDSLDNAALAIAKKNRFTPVFVNGIPKARFAPYQVTFRNSNDTIKSTSTFESSIIRSHHVDTAPNADDYLPNMDEFVPVEIMPEMIHEVAPEYPRLAKQAGISGRVWIRALIGMDGRVLEAVVARSSGFPLIDESALEVAHQNLFRPAVQGGRPVAVWVTYKVDYILSK